MQSSFFDQYLTLAYIRGFESVRLFCPLRGARKPQGRADNMQN